MDEGDLRGSLGLSWFQDGNIGRNLALVDRIATTTKTKGATLAQVTVAWILAQGDDFFAIPGTTKIERLKERIWALSAL